MKKVFSYLLPFKAMIAVSLLFVLVELSVELVQPYLLQLIIDEGLANQDLSYVLWLGAGMIAIALAGFAAGIVNIFFSDHIGQATGRNLRDDMFNVVQQAEVSEVNHLETASLLTRLTNDVNQIQLTIVMFFRFMVRAPLLIIGSTIMAFVINPDIASLLIIAIPVLLLFLIWIMRKSIRSFGLVQHSVDKLNHVMRENLLGIRLVRIFVREKHEADRFGKNSSELRENMLRAYRFTELSVPFLMLVMNTVIVLILWVGGTSGYTENIGDIVAIVNYATRITGALSVLGMLITFYARAKASSSRIAEVLELPEHQKNTTASDWENYEGSIQADRLSYRYPDTAPWAADHLSFSIRAGEKIAILGETGSGKSTLMQLLAGLIEPGEGELYFDEKPVRLPDFYQIRKQLGYVPQQVQLFSGTIRENITLGKPDASHKEIERAAKDAQIHKTITSLRDGYDTQLGQNGINLSGGQKQRLTIARALLLKPAVLLLDDSTSALDMKTEADFLRALNQYENTVMIVTQKLTTALQCDKIMLLEYGKLTAFGTKEELMENSDLFRRIYQSQQQEEVY